MLEREKGWSLGPDKTDIWSMVKTSNGRMYINSISKAYQTEAPPQFQGGIIADSMGLGKTLSMISLVAADSQDHCLVYETRNKIASATLVILPPARTSYKS
jgi:hypothetical protein